MKYIASCSFGKDSLATIILAHIHNEPIDEIIFSEVMFTKEISAEQPDHIDWIYNVAISKLESWGYTVKVLRAERTFEDIFHHRILYSQTPEKVGKMLGFPIPGMCAVNDRLKLSPVKKYYRRLKEDFIQYLGIAVDEPQRLKRMHKSENKVSLLEKYNYTEQMALELCEEYGLLSPLYKRLKRGGCWFCPNAHLDELAQLVKEHPDYWNILKEWAKHPDLWTTKFNRTMNFDELNSKIEEMLQ